MPGSDKRNTIFVRESEGWPDSVGDRMNTAIAMAMKGKPLDALPILEDIVREFPDFTDAHLNIANTFSMLDNKKEAT